MAGRGVLPVPMTVMGPGVRVVVTVVRYLADWVEGGSQLVL